MTFNLNKNINVDWGIEHPSYITSNLKVNLLDLSISWELFNILLPNYPKQHLVNIIKRLDSKNCILYISLGFWIDLHISCDSLIINHEQLHWSLFQGTLIGDYYYFDSNIFNRLCPVGPCLD